MRLCWTENREYMRPEKGQVLVSAEYTYNFYGHPRLAIVEGSRQTESLIDAGEDVGAVCADHIARMNAEHEARPTEKPCYGGMLKDFESLFTPKAEAVVNV